MSAKIRTIAAAAVFSALLSASGAVRAQDGGEGQPDYRKMLEQAMKSGSYGQAQAESWDARLKVLSGTVMVKTVDNDNWVAVTGEMPLDPNDMVKTSADGLADIYLDDKGAMSLGRNTELEVSSLDQTDTVFMINFGSLSAKIKHFLNDKFKFEVRTPSAVCAVRGTEFAVEYSQLGKDTTAAVFDEGRLSVRPVDESGKDNQEYTLEKNTELSFGPSQRRFHPVPVSRMARHRGEITMLRTRLAALKNWKPRSAERRAALRERALKGKAASRALKGSSAAPKGQKGRAAAKSRARAKSKTPAARRSKVRRAARPQPEEPRTEEPQEEGQ